MIQKLHFMFIVCFIVQGNESKCFVVDSFDKKYIPFDENSFTTIEITKEEEHKFQAVITF